ncbi:L-proline trans-4-hydroxylase-like [Mytilus edulis]|uniref:L-proline trans-4-hydroxylase-like n=1 Tax=Mytilus edulis TaxID=6550 RepID=UPI0039F0B6F9
MNIGSDYRFSEPFTLTDQMYNDYHENGYLIIRNMLDKEEINKIEKCVTGEKFMENKYSLEDKDNKIIRVVWRHPGTDVTGIVSRSEKIVSSCEKLLDGEVYHYHAKLIMKEPEVSGPIYWHQDYGYWYHYGNLFPDLLTVWVAVDSSTIENGCLEVLAGSNKCGRLDHHVDDGQNQVAELSRLESIKERCPHVKAEMEKGDVLFLHSNTLHYSSPNRSKMRRIGFLMCYNKASNESVMKHHHAQYTPIQKVPDSAIKECTNFTDMSGKEFQHPNTNTTMIGRKDQSH